MAKRAPGSRAKASRNTIKVTAAVTSTDIRGSWPTAWLELVTKFDTPVALADEIGVSYQTLWRWSQQGAAIPKIGVNMIRCVAEKHGVKKPPV